MVQVPSFPYMSTTLFGNNSSNWKVETYSAVGWHFIDSIDLFHLAKNYFAKYITNYVYNKLLKYFYNFPEKESYN